MADVLLFSPKYNEYIRKYTIPWGLLYISSYLVKAGYRVKIINEVIDEDWRRLVLKELKKNPILVGVSSMTGKQIKNGLAFSKFVKERSDVPIVWGGVHPSILPEQTLKNENIDFVVRGDGEEASVELVESLEKNKDFKNIRGLSYKKEDKIFTNKERALINLNDIPDLPYNLLDMNKYIREEYGAKRSLEICSSRGCPHSCKFCYNQNFAKSKWRTLSVDRILEDLSGIIHKFSLDGVDWKEDNFFTSKARVENIAKCIIKERIDITWIASCRIDYLSGYDQTFMNLLKKCGCRVLTAGVESGSNRILREINKGVTKEQVINVKNKLVKNKIYQRYHFMIGFPTETQEDRMQTVKLIWDLIKKNNFLDGILGPSLYVPYPGTELYSESLDKGFSPPSNLEGWGEMDWSGVDVPWLIGKEKKEVEDITFNIRGTNEKGVRNYFLFKLFLLVNYNIKLPHFEKEVFYKLKKLKLM